MGSSRQDHTHRRIDTDAQTHRHTDTLTERSDGGIEVAMGTSVCRVRVVGGGRVAVVAALEGVIFRGCEAGFLFFLVIFLCLSLSFSFLFGLFIESRS